ncbi:MAG TPA: D-arabinono-1,4-lactone oxidase [Rhodoglobus sp.]|nr:D-arabinono-1,4-lactone oxidase [Rhodoglobus sp.]
MSAILPGKPWRNWGRSAASAPAFETRPASVDDVIAAVRFARERGLTVKPIGAGHSFTAIGATDGVRIDPAGLSGVLGVDGALVTLAAGTFLHQLPALFAPHRLALQNMGDIDRQSISGATSTGTHGTGAAFGGIATRIRAATLVTADAQVLRVSATENPELLRAVALGLGALGVLVDVTIEAVPEFALHALERPAPVETVLQEWPQRIAEADHFEFYVWPHSDRASTKTNTRLPADAPLKPLGPVREAVEDGFLDNEVFGLLIGIGRLLPRAVPAINRLATNVSGDREFSDHWAKVFTSPRRVRFREMEYAIPVEAVPDAVRAVRTLIEARGWRIEFPIEVRAAAADDLWLSTAAGRASGYIAVHRAVHADPAEYFREVEAIMVGHGGRPHWGKMHTRDADYLRTVYPRFDDFIAVRNRLDPERVFANPYLERVLGA